MWIGFTTITTLRTHKPPASAPRQRPMIFAPSARWAPARPSTNHSLVSAPRGLTNGVHLLMPARPFGNDRRFYGLSFCPTASLP